MKKFTGNEIAALILAGVLVLGGASLVLWPQQSGAFIHETSHPYVHGGVPVEEMSAPKSRLWGAAGMVFGIALAAFTMNGRNK